MEGYGKSKRCCIRIRGWFLQLRYKQIRLWRNLIVVNGKKYIIRKSGNEKDAIKLKNVAGEIFGAITVMKAARKLKLKRIKLYFDFSGIEDIALGKIQPKQKNRFLLSYREFFTEINKYMKIDFCKVKSHSGIELNNKADRLAKQAVGLRKEV